MAEIQFGSRLKSFKKVYTAVHICAAVISLALIVLCFTMLDSAPMKPVPGVFFCGAAAAVMDAIAAFRTDRRVQKKQIIKGIGWGLAAVLLLGLFGLSALCLWF